MKTVESCMLDKIFYIFEWCLTGPMRPFRDLQHHSVFPDSTCGFANIAWEISAREILNRGSLGPRNLINCLVKCSCTHGVMETSRVLLQECSSSDLNVVLQWISWSPLLSQKIRLRIMVPALSLLMGGIPLNHTIWSVVNPPKTDKSQAWAL